MISLVPLFYMSSSPFGPYFTFLQTLRFLKALPVSSLYPLPKPAVTDILEASLRLKGFLSLGLTDQYLPSCHMLGLQDTGLLSFVYSLLAEGPKDKIADSRNPTI